MATPVRRTPPKPVRVTTARPTFTAPKPAPPAATTIGALNVEVVRVDLAIATEWMIRNVSNRPLRRPRLAEYKRDMLAGNWRDVGDPIRFDTNGDMCDGQHRMMALINAAAIDPDVSFLFLVIRGVKPEDRRVIDCGTRRTAGDQLRIAGYRNHSLLAAAAKWAAAFDRKVVNASDFSTRSISHAEILAYVEEHPELVSICTRTTGSLRTKIDIPQGYIATAFFLCHRLDPDAAEEFFARLASGVDLPGRSPILALRSRLRDLEKSRANLPGDQWLGLLLRTWNAWREGRTLRTLPVYKDNIAIPCPDAIK